MPNATSERGNSFHSGKLAEAGSDGLNADRRHVWHPFSQMQEYWAQPPLSIARGEGAWLIDTEGRRYLDGTASIWTNVHGHNDADLNRALQQQLEEVAHSTFLGLTHPVGAELAAELVRLGPPGLSRVFFSDNGAGAVEVALKQSFQFWQLTGHPDRRGVIGMTGGYHGDTLGTMAVGDSGFFHARFQPWFLPARHFPAPRCLELGGRVAHGDASESLSALRDLLQREGARTACLILEPSVQGAAGMRQQPPGFLREVAALCREHGVHLILDEVFVAFGRLGSMIVSRDEGVTPDFLCLAKGLTAGYLPLAATLTNERIFSAFLGSYESGNAFFHGHTFTGNPLAAAVALENIRKLEPVIASGSLHSRIDHFGAQLRRHFGAHPGVREVRQRGFAAAIDLCPPNRPAESFAPGRRVGLQVALKARDHGLLLRPLGDSLPLVPPLCVDESEIDQLVSRTLSALNETLFSH